MTRRYGAAEQRRAHEGSGSEIAEFQGLYGSYHVSETLLQKVWLRGEFNLARACTVAGESVSVLSAGTWNRLSGPDFRGARLVIAGKPVNGDIEVHFRVEAWTQHGHDTDPAYDDVVLHVVLFPPAVGAAPMRTRSGREIPVLVLVDLLWHDLEEYVADEAVAALSGRDPLPIVEELLALPAAERSARIDAAAERRWREKVHFAGLRVKRVGWEEACHQTTLEILGYRANRAAMLRVGVRYPWSSWVGADPTIDDLVSAAAEAWTLRGVRPANHPRLRLEQYRTWMARVPDWPRRLRLWRLPLLPRDANGRDAGVLRREARLPSWREMTGGGLCGRTLGGARLDTWIANLLLPFLASEAAEANIRDTVYALWRAWYPGDLPESLAEAARQLRPPGSRSALANGSLQGLLGLQLERAKSAGENTVPR